jgi:hypothetical protein
LLAFVGPTFERDWSEKGTIRKPRVTKGEGVPGPDWYIVQFDPENGGGKLCIHRDRIMVANDQSQAA